MTKVHAIVRSSFLLLPLVLASACQIAPKQEDATKFDSDTAAFVTKVSEKNTKLANLFDTAYGYAVFPVVGEGGLLLAGGFGRGAVYEDGQLIGYARVDQHSIGAVLGGEKWSLLIFFKNGSQLT